jgi:PhnB protein
MSTTATSPSSAKSKVKPVPDGMHTVTPHLVCDGAAAAIEFYKKAFGATELMRVPGPGGKLIHAAVKIGDSIVMLVDAFPEWGSTDPKALKGSPVTIHLAVADVDTLYAQAVAAGCTVVMPLDNMFWGDRYGSVVDPFGHNWSMATHIQELTPEEIAQAMAAQNPCPAAADK